MITSQLKYYNFDSTFKKSGSDENPTFQMPLANNELNYCSVTEVKIPKIYNITDQVDNNGVPMNQIHISIPNGFIPGTGAKTPVDYNSDVTLAVGVYTTAALCIELTRIIYDDLWNNSVHDVYFPLIVFDVLHPENDENSDEGLKSSNIWIFANYFFISSDISVKTPRNNTITSGALLSGAASPVANLILTFSQKLLNILGINRNFYIGTTTTFITNTTFSFRFNLQRGYFNPVYEILTTPYFLEVADVITYPNPQSSFYGYLLASSISSNMNYYSNIYIVCTSPQIITNNIIPGYPSNQVIAVIDTSGNGYPYIVSEKNNLLLNHNTLGNKGSGDVTFAYYDADFNLIKTYGISTSIRLALYHFEPIKNDVITNSYVTTNNGTVSTNRVVGSGIRY